jgi:iron complex outermembrane receptor protein
MGMVNVVTRAPAGRGELAMEAQSRGGFEGWGRAGWVGSNSTWEITGSGFQRKGTALDFPELGVGTLPADVDREERQSAYLRAKGKEWSLTGYAMSRTQRQASAPYMAVIGDPRNFFRDSLVFGEFKIEPRFGTVDTFLRVFADRYVYSSRFSYNGARDPSITNPYVEPERDPSSLYGLEVQARFPLLGQLVTVGSEQKWSQYRTNLAPPDFPVSSQVNSQSGNNYLQVDWDLGTRAHLVLGIQQATQRITRADELAMGEVTSFHPSALQGLTPRFALVLNPTSIDILKLLYGGGYRYPTQTERFYMDEQAYLANPALLPETIRTAEAIWIRTWGNGIQSQLGLSDSQWKRLIEYQDAGGGFIQAINEPGTIRGQSAELEVTGREPGWTWMLQSGVYDWVKQDGTRFPDCARLQGGLRITWLWGPWSLTGEARYVSRREDPSRDAFAPAATTLRTALRWEGRQIWVSASIEDLTNARRVDLVAPDYAPIARMASDGRMGRFSLGYRF